MTELDAQPGDELAHVTLPVGEAVGSGEEADVDRGVDGAQAGEERLVLQVGAVLDAELPAANERRERIGWLGG